MTAEKQEHVLFIKMTKKQDKIYQKFLNSEAVKRVITGDAVCFTVLQRLRAICNHPFFDKGETSDPITDTDITDAIKKATYRFVSKFIPSILCQILFVINFETD